VTVARKSASSKGNPPEAVDSSNTEAASEFDTTAAVTERLAALVAGRPVSAVARSWSLKDATLRQYLKGSMPSLEKAAQIAQAEKVSVHWLATGEGPRDMQPPDALTVMRTEGEHEGAHLRQGTVLTEESDDAVALPRLSVEGSAGKGLIPSQEEIDDYLSVSRRYLREVGINPMYAHVLRLSGHSMAPTLHDKDLVIVDTSQTSIRDEEIYAVAYGETVLIKRLRPQWDGSLKIISDNKGGHYEDALVPSSERDQLRIVGRVGGFLRYL
jgi:phage repressor protein C with HTH and peptisase S24 domain